MTPPVGTFIARVMDGGIELPPAIHAYCGVAGWTLFRFVVVDRNHMVMRPVLTSTMACVSPPVGRHCMPRRPHGGMATVVQVSGNCLTEASSNAVVLLQTSLKMGPLSPKAPPTTSKWD